MAPLTVRSRTFLTKTCLNSTVPSSTSSPPRLRLLTPSSASLWRQSTTLCKFCRDDALRFNMTRHFPLVLNTDPRPCRCAAGQTIEGLRGSPTAVYVGVMCDDWAQISNRDWDLVQTYAATGTSRCIISNRISYFFDWHGPSMTIDTACSSSLVCVHQAVQALRSGESRVAIAAGANLILSPGKL